MSDLISKQESIDAISVYANRYKKYIGKPNDSEVYAYSRGLIASIEMSINALPSAQQWVSVTEGLPDKDVPVFVYLFGDVPYIAWINRDGEWETEEFIIDCDYLPKAWMPLPEPYKEAGDDDNS